MAPEMQNIVDEAERERERKTREACAIAETRARRTGRDQFVTTTDHITFYIRDRERVTGNCAFMVAIAIPPRLDTGRTIFRA